MKHLTTITIALFLFSINSFAQTKDVKNHKSEGQLIDTIIPAPSLKGNLINTADKQPIAIYLPPSYNKTDKKYPVVYYLPGFGSFIRYYTFYGAFQGFRLKESMDELINSGKIKEMIVVMPNSVNYFAGHFYVNSPVSGNWDNFIVKDLLNFMDDNYRTINNRESRGIAGHSMGGFGALNLAMLHSDIFSMTYAISPGIFDEKGLSKHKPLTDENIVNAFLDKQEELQTMDKGNALASTISYIYDKLIINQDYITAFCYAYGTAFSPNPNGHPPYINYMYKKKGDKLVVIEKNRKNYENGYGNFKEKVTKYEKNFKSLKSITIDCGSNDNYAWIPEGCLYLSKLFKEKEIKHNYSEHEGTHSGRLNERITEHMFPLFSKELKFE